MFGSDVLKDSGRKRVRWSVVVSVVVLFAVVTVGATGTAAAQSAPDCSTVTYNGDGTDANPYEVGNVDQLQCIEDQGLDRAYVLVSDIGASGTSQWNDGKGFEPIGEFNFSRDAEYNGTFDGNGYNVTDLTIDRGKKDFVGLFGAVGSVGTVINVGVVDADINGSRRVGGLVGRNEGMVNESYASGSVDSSDEVGGLVGENDGTVSDSYATGEVNGSNRLGSTVNAVGGLVGVNLREGTVSNSYATGSVDGESEVGGLVGLKGGIVEKSYATGSVYGSSEVGGLIGNNFDGSTRESYATGSVYGSSEVGGLAGRSFGGTIEKSYSTASVEGTEEVGGLVGRNNGGTVSESYATGLVEGDDDIGGLVGFNAAGTISKSYWDEETTGLPNSNGGTGLTTTEMTGSDVASNMTGFDFTSTWETVSGDYPVLRWQTTDSDDDAGSPVEDVSDELWTAVTQDDNEQELSITDLDNAIQQYQANPENADVGGVDIGLSDLGALIQYYRNVVV